MNKNPKLIKSMYASIFYLDFQLIFNKNTIGCAGNFSSFNPLSPFQNCMQLSWKSFLRSGKSVLLTAKISR